uniref:Autophagy-related protein 28 n=2 Tax=Schistosoma mansoni TaxID=6183 RepID=A0A3Q0KS83_SCHMA
MSDHRENFFKHPRRKTAYIASRYLEKANTIHRSASSVREKPINERQNSSIVKRQSSPKFGVNVSNARLVIDDSIASAIHSHDNMGHGSVIEHSSGSLTLDNPVKKFNELDVDSLSDISLAAYTVWTLFQRYTSHYIVNKVECDYVKIVDLLNRIKSTREEIIRLRKTKHDWENWFQSVKDLHNERKILTDLIQMLGISECNTKENDNSLDSQHFNQTELIPQLEQSILQKFSPVFNRLIVNGINLDTFENVSYDLQQLSDIASLFSNISENDLDSFEQLADEVNNFADHLQNQIYPQNIVQYEQLMQCLQTFILYTSLKCEQIERKWLKEIPLLD